MNSSTDIESPSKMDYSRQGSNLTLNRSSTTSWGTFINTPEAEPEVEKPPDSAMLPDLTTDNDTYLRAKNYTPDELLDLPENRPDISIFCSDCQRFVDLRLMTEHKNYHKALDVLKYKGKSRPESVTDLMKRRRAVIRRMKKNTPANTPLLPADIHKVNDAYEFIKADMQDTFEVYRRVVEHNSPVDADGVALNCSPNCVTAVGMCQSINSRWKSAMEDTRVFQDYFGNDQHKAFFAIYDGHSGKFAAEIAANELHHAILSEMSKFDPSTKCTCTLNMADKYDISDYDIPSRPQSAKTDTDMLHRQSSNVIHQVIRTCEEKMAEINAQKSTSGRKSKNKKSPEKEGFPHQMSEAFTNAHKYTDILLSWGKDERSKVRWSGCSSLNVVIQDTPHEEKEEDNIVKEENGTKQQPPVLKELGMIHLANAGNVRGILVRGNKHYTLTRDHTPHNPRENKRILKQGGSISESERVLLVNGVLLATRGLGNHGDVALRKCVSTEPYTCSVPIDQYAQFLILGSNGLWEIFTDEEVTKLALQRCGELRMLLPENQVPAPSRVGESVLRLIEPQPSGPGSQVSTVLAGLDDSTTEANDLRRHSSTKPRTSTAQSRASIVLPDDDDGHNSQHQQMEEVNNSKNKPSQYKGLQVAADLNTEVGSRIDGYSDDSDGNDGDIDTEGLSEFSCDHVPSREELQREFVRGVSEHLIQAALLAGANDNITVTIIMFPGAGI